MLQWGRLMGQSVGDRGKSRAWYSTLYWRAGRAQPADGNKARLFRDRTIPYSGHRH